MSHAAYFRQRLHESYKIYFKEKSLAVSFFNTENNLFTQYIERGKYDETLTFVIQALLLTTRFTLSF